MSGAQVTSVMGWDSAFDLPRGGGFGFAR
jgi:hypothetical protein